MPILTRIGGAIAVPLLVVCCALLAVSQWDAARQARTQAEQAGAQVVQLQQANAELVAGMTVTTERLDAIDGRLGEFKQQTEQRITDVFWSLEKAKKHDKQTADWAAGRVPDAVVDGLCRHGFIDPAKRAELCPATAAPVR